MKWSEIRGPAEEKPVLLALAPLKSRLVLVQRLLMEPPCPYLVGLDFAMPASLS